MSKVLRYWLPPILATVLILLASGDMFRSDVSEGLFQLMARMIGWEPSLETTRLANLLIRKASHLTEYAIDAALWLRAQRGEHRGLKIQWMFIALLLAVGVASADESRQALTTTRTGSAWDVMLDGVGATIGILLFAQRSSHEIREKASR